MLTSNFRPEVEIRPFRARAMKNMRYNRYYRNRNSSVVVDRLGYGPHTTFHLTYFQFFITTKSQQKKRTYKLWNTSVIELAGSRPIKQPKYSNVLWRFLISDKFRQIFAHCGGSDSTTSITVVFSVLQQVFLTCQRHARLVFGLSSSSTSSNYWSDFHSASSVANVTRLVPPTPALFPS